MTIKNFITTSSSDLKISSFLLMRIDRDLAMLEHIDEKAMPMLFFKETLSSSLWHKHFLESVVDRHQEAARYLLARGLKRAVICADNDGLLAHMLSPRFSNWSLDKRMELLLRIYTELSKMLDQVWVSLTIEELIPGGMDATDGIAVAKALHSLGLRTIIVASGTRDFLPLYQRKITKKKMFQEEDFYSNEPGLASALWVREATTLKVWVLSYVDDERRALALAKQIGLEGIIVMTNDES